MEFKREFKGYKRAEVDAYITRLNESHESDSARQRDTIYELKNKLNAAEKELAELKEQSSVVTKAIENAVAKADEIERLSKLKYRQEMEQLKAFHEKWLSYYKKLLKKYPTDGALHELGAFNRSMSEILDRGEAALPADQYRKENDRLGERRRIGYIDVAAPESDLSDDEIMREILPDLPAGETDFRPEEMVREYLGNRSAAEKAPPRKKSEKAKKPVDKRDAPAAKKSDARPADYPDRSESGFSFEEALHPTENLEDIMRDLGLFGD